MVNLRNKISSLRFDDAAVPALGWDDRGESSPGYEYDPDAYLDDFSYPADEFCRHGYLEIDGCVECDLASYELDLRPAAEVPKLALNPFVGERQAHLTRKVRNASRRDATIRWHHRKERAARLEGIAAVSEQPWFAHGRKLTIDSPIDRQRSERTRAHRLRDELAEVARELLQDTFAQPS